MNAQLLAALIMLPITAVFVYAGFHEYRRYKIEGRATYGLSYDEETGTTHLTGISDADDAYNPEDFDPNDYNDPDIKNEDDADKS